MPFVIFFHLGGAMGFQSNLLSDKGLYEHHAPALSLSRLENGNAEIGLERVCG